MSKCILQPLNRAQDTSILIAARNGNLIQLRELIEQLSTDEQHLLSLHGNIYGKNILHEAAQNGREDVVRYCVSELGLEVDSLKQGDWTALMLCACKPGPSSAKVCTALINAEADVNRTNKDGWTAAHLAVRADNMHVLLLLCARDKNVLHTKSKTGRTLLHSASLHGHFPMIKFLLSNLPLIIISHQDNCGSTAFMDSLRNGHLNIAEKLLTFDDEMDNMTDNCGLLPIHVAAECGQLEAIKYLVSQRKIDIGVVDSCHGMNVAHFAAREGHKEILEYLVSTGHTRLLTVACKHAKTPLQLAVINRKTECGDLIKLHCSAHDSR